MFLKLQPRLKYLCTAVETVQNRWKLKGIVICVGALMVTEFYKSWADSHVRWSNCLPGVAVNLRGFYWTAVLLVRSLYVTSKAWPQRTIERILILSFGIDFMLYLAPIPLSLYLMLQQLVATNSVAWTLLVSGPYLICDLCFVVERFYICGKCTKWTHDEDVV